MNDLERALRDELGRRANEAETVPPGMERVRRRARRRQAVTVLVSLVVIASVSLGAVQAIRYAGTTEPGEGGAERQEHRAVLASGRAEGGRWKLIVRRGDQDWCLGIEVARGVGEGCGFGVPPDDLSVGGTTLEGLTAFVEGVVSKRVARVRVELDDGSILEPDILEPPPELGAPFDAFVLVLDEPIGGRVVVYDSQDLVLARQRIWGPDDSPEHPTVEDEKLIQALRAFAELPSRETWERVPFAPGGVWLGLGERLLVKRSPEELADPAAWVHDVEDFRALVGPFSALDLLREAESVAVSVGPHPHCASPPMPPPDRVATLRRVSVQPEAIDTCLRWWTVDAFVTERGEIMAIALDRWEA